MLARLRRIQPLAYVFLGFSVVGAISEVLFHFVPPQSLSLVNRWLESLSPVDRDFYGLALELAAHICIAIGLMGLVAMYLYKQLDSSGNG